jgi:hypothetical protein
MRQDEFADLDGDVLQGMGGQQSVGNGFGEGFDELARGGDGD